MANKTRQKYSNDLNEQWSAFNFPLNFEKFLEFEEYLSVNDKAEEFVRIFLSLCFCLVSGSIKLLFTFLFQISYLENLLKTNCKTKPRSTLRMVLKGIISDEIFVYYFWAEEKKMAEETRLRWRRRRGNLLIPRCQHVS